MIITNHLRLKKIKYEKRTNYVHFKISYQSNLWRAGYSIKTVFSSLNENYCRIESSDHPEANEYSDILYIWGLDDSRDDALLECSKEFYQKIVRTIKYLNNIKKKSIY